MFHEVCIDLLRMGEEAAKDACKECQDKWKKYNKLNDFEGEERDLPNYITKQSQKKKT